MTKVVRIIDSEAKTGEKNGKTWSTSRVELDNGETAYIFNPVSENDEVESYENKGYKNWRKVKSQAGGGNTDLDKAFKYLFDQNKEILAALDTIATMITDLSAKQPVTDKDMDKPISLDDVPFGGDE